MRLSISIQQETFNLQQELDKLNSQDAKQGAVVSFVGTVRADHADLEALHIEHYPVMTEQQINAAVETARERWSLLAVTVIHRVGRLALGENIVLILVASAHRKAAFAACDFIMDYLKMQAPFWKQELYTAQSGIKPRWLEAKQSDKNAYDAW